MGHAYSTLRTLTTICLITIISSTNQQQADLTQPVLPAKTVPKRKTVRKRKTVPGNGLSSTNQGQIPLLAAQKLNAELQNDRNNHNDKNKERTVQFNSPLSQEPDSQDPQSQDFSELRQPLKTVRKRKTVQPRQPKKTHSSFDTIASGPQSIPDSSSIPHVPFTDTAASGSDSMSKPLDSPPMQQSDASVNPDDTEMQNRPELSISPDPVEESQENQPEDIPYNQPLSTNDQATQTEDYTSPRKGAAGPPADPPPLTRTGTDEMDTSPVSSNRKQTSYLEQGHKLSHMKFSNISKIPQIKFGNKYFKECYDQFGIISFISSIPSPRHPQYLSLIRHWGMNCNSITPQLWYDYYKKIPDTVQGDASRQAMIEFIQFQTIKILQYIKSQQSQIYRKLIYHVWMCGTEKSDENMVIEAFQKSIPKHTMSPKVVIKPYDDAVTVAQEMMMTRDIGNPLIISVLDRNVQFTGGVDDTLTLRTTIAANIFKQYRDYGVFHNPVFDPKPRMVEQFGISLHPNVYALRDRLERKYEPYPVAILPKLKFGVMYAYVRDLLNTNTVSKSGKLNKGLAANPDLTMKQMLNALQFAVAKGYRNIIIDGFGEDKFGYDASMIAPSWQRVINQRKFKGRIDSITFALYGKSATTKRVFNQQFTSQGRAEVMRQKLQPYPYQIRNRPGIPLKREDIPIKWTWKRKVVKDLSEAQMVSMTHLFVPQYQTIMQDIYRNYPEFNQNGAFRKQVPPQSHPHPAADKLIGMTGLQYFGSQKASHFLDHPTLIEFEKKRYINMNFGQRIGNKYIDFIFPWPESHPDTQQFRAQLKLWDYQYLLSSENDVFFNTLIDDVDIILSIKKRNANIDYIINSRTRMEQFYCSIYDFQVMAYIFSNQPGSHNMRAHYIRRASKLYHALKYIRKYYGKLIRYYGSFDCMQSITMACDPTATK